MTDVQTTPAGPDRRALWLSLGGGSLSGFLVAWPPLQAVLMHRPVNYDDMSNVEGPVFMVGGALSILVPLLVTALARRKPFLWGLLALTANLFWATADRVAAGNWAGMISDMASNAPGNAAVALVVCAPIALCRYVIRRKRERAAYLLLAEQQAWRDASTQEGVWPPPPTV